MKHVSRLAVLGVAITLGVVAASQSEARQPRPDFETLDSNGDGQITKAEFAAHQAERFARVDTNGDGQLSLTELQAQSEERAQKRAARMIEHLDKNEDGLLSEEELAGARRGNPDRMFQRVDADEDGVITKAEFDAMHDKAASRRKP